MASITGRELRTAPARRMIEEEEKQPAIPDRERLIVAVDDHPMNIDVLEYLLVKKLDRNVICCLSGEEALRQVRQKAQRMRGLELSMLVLMDINMPTMDGFETTRRLKEILISFNNV